MTGIVASRAVGQVDAPESDRARLQRAVQQLQGVFVEQLLKAMRETVPDEGVVGRSSGEEIFNGMLDARLASLVPAAWQRNGLESALLRQLHATPPASDEPAAGRVSDPTGSR